MIEFVTQSRRMISLMAVITIFAAIFAFSPALTTLEQVLADNELVVVTRHDLTTYFENQQGPTGFEYELAKAFADELGVKLTLQQDDSLNGIFNHIFRDRAHFAAAGLTITPDRKQFIKFSTPYQEITQQLIFRVGEKQPRSAKDLIGKSVLVMANSSHSERLKQLKTTHPELRWTEVDSTSVEELITLVNEGHIDHTIIDSNSFAVHRRLYPELGVAFNISVPESLAWAFPKSNDNSLYQAAQAFLEKKRASGSLAKLKAHYYNHTNNFNYVNAKSFVTHLENRLPNHIEHFKQAGIQEGIDWRLLAAMGYQESLWNPDAVSPTGVRGMMMLTRMTAKELGVDNRTDALQSIYGGAAYLRKILNRLPSDIGEPDRTWLAIAAYNVGFGHVTDARLITERQGDNPYSWVDISQRLPLLKNKSWYKDTRYGYARGGAQSVIYVEQIRKYYDLLVWITNSQKLSGSLMAMNTNVTSH